MLPFNSNTTQTQSKSTSKFNTHMSEEQSEGEQIKVDSIVTLESHPTELEVVFGTINVLDTVDLSSDGEGSDPYPYKN